VERLVKGVPVRGVGTTIELDEQGFAGEGDLYLFASVVDEVLAAHAGLNTFSELKVKAHPSQAEYQWTAKSGRQTIL
jgi:type VI secretion system protein ImpG